MAKGFSFVLVAVVMVVMTVFGLLALSSAGADLRLSQKGAQAQTVYYELDGRGEELLAACEAASVSAAEKSREFMEAKKYAGAPPAGLFSCLLPLVSQVKARPDPASPVYRNLERGLYFYFLEDELAAIRDDGLAFRIDAEALEAVLQGRREGGAAIATVSANIVSGIDARFTLNILLECPFNAQDGHAFAVRTWAEAVAGNEIHEPGSPHLWEGN